MKERCKLLTSGFRHASLKSKKIRVPRRIRTRVSSQYSSGVMSTTQSGHHRTGCGNFIDVSRSNAANSRDIFCFWLSEDEDKASLKESSCGIEMRHFLKPKCYLFLFPLCILCGIKWATVYFALFFSQRERKFETFFKLTSISQARRN